MNISNDDKVAVYIDGSNLYHSLRNLASKTNLDFLAFARKLAGSRKLQRIYYYNALVDNAIEPDRYQEQQKFLNALRHVDYLEVRLGRLIYRDEPNIAPYEKGIDVKLATDMLVHATRGNYNVAILVSGDADFKDALQPVKDFGHHVEVALFDPLGSSRELREVADRVIRIDKGFLEGCWRK